VSVVIPVYNEGEAIVACLDRLLQAVRLPCEVLVVYDDPADSTLPYLEKYVRGDERVVPMLNGNGAGPARAIRWGIEHANAPVAVVTMADGSDDPEQIDRLTNLVDRGVVIAAASRYMGGGRQIGGPPVKTMLSNLAGLSR
jgi:glycosyltransferase involved in cell wall biosynthesis